MIKCKQMILLVLCTISLLGNALAADLSANIMRRVNSANLALDQAEDSISRARATSAQSSVDKAQIEYNNIFKYYPGSFDPEHPTMVTLKQRLEIVSTLQKQRAPVDLGFKKISEAVAEIDRLANMPEKNQEYTRLANNQLQYAEQIKAEIMATGVANADANKADFETMNSQLAKAKQQLAALDAGHAQQAQQQVANQSAANQQLTEKLQNRYPQQTISSQLYQNNIGKMVWSKSEIQFRAQDQAIIEKRFSLSDPIFGRLYLAHSLGNSPVYSDQDPQTPLENHSFGYIYRLFIDGQEKVYKFNVFLQGKYTDDAATAWLTFQFVPNPIPFSDDYKQEADAWRVATKGLSAGEHQVRFEFWGADGAFKTKQPLSVGEFTLVVNSGDRISAGGQFPQDSYSGNDVQSVKSSLKSALVGPVAKNANEILDIAITSDWQYGTYQVTKQRYRTIVGTVLWADKDNDQVCRYTSYKFVSDQSTSNQWGALRYKAFCLNCAEGDAECKQK